MRTLAILSLAAGLAGLQLLPADAANRNIAGGAERFRQKLMLGCSMDNPKDLIITNTSGHTIAANTTYYFTSVRYRDGANVDGSVLANSAVAPNGRVPRHVEESRSCTAWIMVTPQLNGQ